MKLYTVAEVARDFGLAPSSIRARLSRHASLFVATYRRGPGGHPRLRRVLTETDVRVLASLVTTPRLGRWSG